MNAGRAGTDDARDAGDDARLAQGVREGDTRAYAELWRRHAAAGRAIARRYAHDADAEDLAAEAFARIFRALRGGGGPRGEFRPYLSQTIRHVATDRGATGNEVSLDTVAEAADADSDPANFVPEQALTRNAFRSLSQRWQTVLWYTEVEGMRPDEVAPLLRLSPSGVSALAYRAREGLRRAWLQAHIRPGALPPECRWSTERMPAAVRDALADPARSRFDSHLVECERCTHLYEDLRRLNVRLTVLILLTIV